jgi:undecaprenyl-diphosphatase
VSWFEAIVLGIVQGLTEFLPISSTGHLRIIPAFAGWEDPGAAFTAIVQLGTTLAVLIYFRADLIAIASAWFRSLRDPSVRGTVDARLGWYLIVATVPISIFGFAFDDQIETGARDLYLIGTVLVVFAFVMLLAERIGRRERGDDDIGPRDAIAIGFAQAMALVPGVSRSGATISAGLFLGMKREAAARFSFLLSTPAIVLAALYSMRGVVTGEETTDAGVGPILVSVLFAFIAGYASIAWLLRFLTSHGLGVFVGYRVALGAAVLALTAAAAIS